MIHILILAALSVARPILHRLGRCSRASVGRSRKRQRERSFHQFGFRASLRRVTMPPTAVETLRAWLLSALVVHSAVAGNPDAKRLYDDLLSNYNKLVRPVVNTSDVLRVCIKLKLSQLIDVVRHPLLFLRKPMYHFHIH